MLRRGINCQSIQTWLLSIQGGNLGYAGGINLALQAAGDARAYLILNPDLRLEPGGNHCHVAPNDGRRGWNGSAGTA